MSSLNKIYQAFCSHPKISTDSRNVLEGSLFFALKGENFDGNRYADAALEAGAVLAVVDNPTVVRSDKHILVEDTLTALQNLANLHRRALGIPILAITGSNGKTTTKELVSRVLACKFRCSTTQGNLNNHIGVPLTLLAMNSQTEFGIVEMGANHLHEIEALCRIAEPNFGIITNIGKAHLEGFGGEQGVAKGKGELFEWLEHKNGTAFYLKESEKLVDLCQKFPQLSTIPYSITPYSAITESEYLCVNYKHIRIDTQLVGDYNLFNVAAAVAIGEFFDVDLEDVSKAIHSFVPMNNRSQRQQTAHNSLIIDAYNANPSSMQLAISNFFNDKSSALPKVLILGDMRELGEYSAEEHYKIALQALTENPEQVLLVGEHFANAVNRINTSHCNEPNSSHCKTFLTTDELLKHLTCNPLRNKNILIKGSRGMRLETTIPLL